MHKEEKSKRNDYFIWIPNWWGVLGFYVLQTVRLKSFKFLKMLFLEFWTDQDSSDLLIFYLFLMSDCLVWIWNHRISAFFEGFWMKFFFNDKWKGGTAILKGSLVGKTAVEPLRERERERNSDSLSISVFCSWCIYISREYLFASFMYSIFIYLF